MVVKWNIVLLFAHLCALCTGFDSSYQIRQDEKDWLQYSYSPELEGYVKLHTEPADWHSARVRCHMEGAFLASPWFAKFAAVISKIQTGKSQLKMVYSGMLKTFAEGALTDVEGVLGISSHPSDLMKLERCGVFLADGSTGEVGCEELLPFVCYRPASNPGGDTDTETETVYLSPSTTDLNNYYFNIPMNEYSSTTDSVIAEYTTYTEEYPSSTELETATASESDTDYILSTTEDYVTTEAELESESIAKTSAVALSETPDCGKANNGIFIEYSSTTDSEIAEYTTYTEEYPSSTELETATASESDTDYILSTTEDYVTTEAELESESIAKTSAVALSETPDCGKANSGYKFSENTNHCYKFHTQAVHTWYDAKAACEEEDAYLAIVNSDVEADVLKKLFELYPAEKIQGASDTETAAIGYLKNYAYNWVTIKGDSLEKAGFATWRRDARHPWASLGFFGRDGLLYGYVSIIRNVAFICEKDTYNIQDLGISTEKPVLTTQKEQRNTPKYVKNTDYF